MQHSRINVHIMRGDAVLTAGLHAILSAQSYLNATLHAICPQALNTAHIVVADYQSGIAAARSETIQQILPRPPILIVTGRAREEEIRQAMAAGVHGYLLPDVTAEELLKAVHALSLGSRYMAEAVSHRLADSMRRESLTARETDVLHLLARGSCNKSIASELGIGVGTVKSHMRGLMSKLHATARTQVVIRAAERGLIASQAQPHAFNYD